MGCALICALQGKQLVNGMLPDMHLKTPAWLKLELILFPISKIESPREQGMTKAGFEDWGGGEGKVFFFAIVTPSPSLHLPPPPCPYNGWKPEAHNSSPRWAESAPRLNGNSWAAIENTAQGVLCVQNHCSGSHWALEITAWRSHFAVDIAASS